MKLPQWGRGDPSFSHVAMPPGTGGRGWGPMTRCTSITTAASLALCKVSCWQLSQQTSGSCTHHHLVWIIPRLSSSPHIGLAYQGRQYTCRRAIRAQISPWHWAGMETGVPGPKHPHKSSLYYRTSGCSGSTVPYLIIWSVTLRGFSPLSKEFKRFIPSADFTNHRTVYSALRTNTSQARMQ